MTNRIASLAMASAVFALAAVFFVCSAPAQAAVWCAHYSNGGNNCGFSSQEQCLADVRGIGGDCNREGGGEERPKAHVRRKKASESKPRKKPRPERPATRQRPPAAAPQPAPPRPALAPPAPPQPVVQPAPIQQPANSFRAAWALILSGKYEAGIAAMKSLGYDDHPDIASAIGFAYAKLGRLVEARAWYDRALAADPNHLSTLGYSGELFVQQGELDKARADLARIKAVCGGAGCGQYRELERLIAAKQR
jgi:tetratricopeptide (TPR) repeat protein